MFRKKFLWSAAIVTTLAITGSAFAFSDLQLPVSTWTRNSEFTCYPGQPNSDRDPPQIAYIKVDFKPGTNFHARTVDVNYILLSGRRIDRDDQYNGTIWTHDDYLEWYWSGPSFQKSRHHHARPCVAQ